MSQEIIKDPLSEIIKDLSILVKKLFFNQYTQSQFMIYSGLDESETRPYSFSFSTTGKNSLTCIDFSQCHSDLLDLIRTNIISSNNETFWKLIQKALKTKQIT